MPTCTMLFRAVKIPATNCIPVICDTALVEASVRL